MNRVIANQSSPQKPMLWILIWRLGQRKTNKMACTPSDGLDQPMHLPSLIRVFAVHMKNAWILSYSFSAQQRFWSAWADAQADLSLRWAHIHLVGFIWGGSNVKTYFPRAMAHHTFNIRGGTWETSDMCAQLGLKSGCASKHSNQSSLSAWRNFAF